MPCAAKLTVTSASAGQQRLLRASDAENLFPSRFLVITFETPPHDYRCGVNKTTNTTCSKCYACHAKCTWTSPMRAHATKNETWTCKTLRIYCACHTKRRWTHVDEDEKLQIRKARRQNRCRQRRSEHTIGKFATVADIATPNERRQTVADGCERKRNSERTVLHPQTGKVKREQFATHSGQRGC